MGNPKIFNRTQFKFYRKDLRNNSTSAEVKLWMHLKDKQLLGRKFRRQTSIGKYIVDFYCPSEKLVIELDGEAHFWEEGMKKDDLKTAYLNAKGIRVIRFENKWVFEDLEYVMGAILNEISMSEK